MRDAAERQPRLFDRVALDFERRCHRHQREGVGEAVAYLQVGVILGKPSRWQLDRGDDLVGFEVRIALRRVAGKAVKILQRDHALARGAGDVHLRLEHRESHAHVGRVRGDASFARAENCVHPVMAADRGAAAAGLALVAGRSDVVEIRAARSLQQIAARRCHIAQLLRRAGANRARQDGIALLDQRVIGEIAVRHERSDTHAP